MQTRRESQSGQLQKLIRRVCGARASTQTVGQAGGGGGGLASVFVVQRGSVTARVMLRHC